jgi:hypothetical protein
MARMNDHTGTPVAPDLERIEAIANEFVTLGVSQEAVEPIRDWVRDRRVGKPQMVVFFGCWRDVGHFLHLPGGRHPKRDDPRFPTYYSAGPFKSLDGWLTPSNTKKQSTAAVHHRDGWTAIGIHDYTVDKRGGANSVFVMDSDLSFDRALTYAREFFPAIVERISSAAPIVCVQTEGALDDAR